MKLKSILFAAPWWHEDLMHGVARQAARRRWHLNLEPALSGRMPDDWSGDGILTTLGGARTTFARFWQRVACPAVSLSLNHPDLPIPRVGINNEAAGRLAAEHLLERGFTSFAFYSCDAEYVSEQRYAAFAASLLEAGHTPHRLIIGDKETDGSGRWMTRRRALQRFLRRVPRPVGVFAVDDASGVEVIEACQTLDLDVPQQVGVLGMLDMPLFRQSTTVPLSSITVDFASHTETACDVLASMMDGAPPPTNPILFSPTGVAVRASTDVIAARHPGVARAIRFMLEHYAEPIGVNDVVAASGMSQTRLYAAFSQDIDQTPAGVLTRIRLNNARRRLRDSADKIDAIAQSCGFGSRINLYRLFTQHVGTSPGAFRKAARLSHPSTASAPAISSRTHA